MSRTDVHRPAWVQERDPWLRREFVPWHNHWIHDVWDEQRRRYMVRRSAPCDLETFLNAKGWVRTRCRLVHRGGRNVYCGCRLCTGQMGRRLARRQERMQWRVMRRALLTAVDPEDVDVVLPRRRVW